MSLKIASWFFYFNIHISGGSSSSCKNKIVWIDPYVEGGYALVICQFTCISMLTGIKPHPIGFSTMIATPITNVCDVIAHSISIEPQNTGSLKPSFSRLQLTQ